MGNVLAVDLGASGGRLIVGLYDGETIELKEVHRFNNGAIKVNGTLYWDILALTNEIYQGIKKAKEYNFKSISIDTWGVDFGLIGKDGSLLENPIHYRDKRTEGMIEKAFTLIDKEEFYAETGIQFMALNTVFQLLSLKEKRSHLLDESTMFLFTPDLLNYFLTGEKFAEYTIASTSQLLDVNSGNWSEIVISKLGLPREIFPKIIKTGSKIGQFTKEICEDLEIDAINVIAGASHDTQSAMVAVPALNDDFLFISCGTWSLVGTELDKPIVNDKAYKYNITNEGAYGNKISFLKNVTGLWVLQQCRNYWNENGNNLDYGDLTELAVETVSKNIFIDTDHELFSQPGNMPSAIDKYCELTNQEKPNSIGEYVNCILESLALKYKQAIDEIKDCTTKEYKCLHLVGGGTKNAILCQYTSNACNIPVVAGPVEATALGNVVVQLIANKEISDIKEARKIITNLKEVKHYTPVLVNEWIEKFKTFKKILNF